MQHVNIWLNCNYWTLNYYRTYKTSITMIEFSIKFYITLLSTLPVDSNIANWATDTHLKNDYVKKR